VNAIKAETPARAGEEPGNRQGPRTAKKPRSVRPRSRPGKIRGARPRIPDRFHFKAGSIRRRTNLLAGSRAAATHSDEIFKPKPKIQAFPRWRARRPIGEGGPDRLGPWGRRSRSARWSWKKSPFASAAGGCETRHITPRHAVLPRPWKTGATYARSRLFDPAQERFCV